ncbi:MAG TPA: type II toxin-antitoxin system VapC family toxin [Stellaceae bacterium]|nr:type II toxin-antitoxin system VapC family toxin [Stellaceae bacterium]
MYALDSNAVIGYLNGRQPGLASRLEAEMRIGAILLIPVVVLYELLYGAARSDRDDHNRARIAEFLTGPFDVLDFTPADAAEAADIRAHLERRGAPIGPYDTMIAAQARRRGATLVTANHREFARVPGLSVDDWTE